MNRRHLVVLMFVLMLLFTVISFKDGYVDQSTAVFGSPESIRILEVDSGGTEKVRPEFVAGEVLVRFGRKVSEGEIAGLRVAQGVEELFVSRFSGVRRWRVPPSRTVLEWGDFFGRHPLVEYAEPNYVRSAFWVPDDPFYGYQWNFDDDHTLNPGGASVNPYGGGNGGGIGLEEVWGISSGSADVVVAVIDTGVAYEDYSIPLSEKLTVKPGVKDYERAPDLAITSFWVNEDEIPGNGVDDDGNGFVDDVNGWDFVNDDAHPNDNNGHGTHVTGTVAQSTDNGLGCAGVAFGTTVMPIKVLDYDGWGNDFYVAEGIYYAANNSARIINLSLGGPDFSDTLEDAVAYAYDNGVVVVAASGNGGGMELVTMVVIIPLPLMIM